MIASKLKELVADEYSRNARLKPAFVVAFPGAVALGGLGAEVSVALGAAVTTATTLGVPFLLSQLARDRGKLKQEELFRQWGGKPTVAKLRHRDRSINALTRSRYLQKLSVLLPGIAIPTAEMEKADPESADQAYEALGDYLISKTRDKSRFPLVFAENVNYGFRRNLWGMRAVGFVVSAISVAAMVFAALLQLILSRAVSPSIVIPFVTGLAMLLVWGLMITPGWVRIAADAYAERLLAAADDLELPKHAGV